MLWSEAFPRAVLSTSPPLSNSYLPRTGTGSTIIVGKSPLLVTEMSIVRFHCCFVGMSFVMEFVALHSLGHIVGIIISLSLAMCCGGILVQTLHSGT